MKPNLNIAQTNICLSLSSVQSACILLNNYGTGIRHRLLEALQLLHFLAVKLLIRSESVNMEEERFAALVKYYDASVFGIIMPDLLSLQRSLM